MSFEAWFTDYSEAYSTILSGPFGNEISMFSEKGNYPMRYETKLVDKDNDVFITTFGLDIDLSRYKIPAYSSDCYEQIEYTASTFAGISTDTENATKLSIKYETTNNNIVTLTPVNDAGV